MDEEEEACSTHLCGNAAVGVDKSYTEAYTDHEGERHGEGLGDRLSAKSGHRKVKASRMARHRFPCMPTGNSWVLVCGFPSRSDASGSGLPVKPQNQGGTQPVQISERSNSRAVGSAGCPWRIPVLRGSHLEEFKGREFPGETLDGVPRIFIDVVLCLAKIDQHGLAGCGQHDVGWLDV